MKITLHVLRNMNQTDLANTLETKLATACYRKLKSKLREKCQKINEGISQHGTTALLNEIYTELYITEGGSGEMNNEHEVRQIETESRRPATQETPIKCSDIFRPLPGQDKAIRTVLTKGVAGIGKTVSVQKFILDWSEGNVNEDVLFIFPLPFRELNLMKEKKLSLVQLLHCFFPETRELKPTHYTYYKILFIFDGLDECRLPLDFQNNDSVWDVTESTSVDVLLTNLIKGNLLPSALLWITSRPAAANQIPPESVDQVTEVRGFSGPQKEEYFRKRIRDQSLANRIISHMKSSRSLYIMCHIPVFCWIAATVLERMLGEAESGEIPKTLTQMFTHFLIFHIKHKHQKYDQKRDTDPQQTRKHVLALGKLAFQQLEKGNLIFYEEDLRNSGIDVREMSVYSGMCTQIFREEFGLQLGKVFSFVHLSVQEFLAALYVLITFISTNTNVLQQQQPGFFSIFKKSIFSLLNSAVDKALQSQNGHLDLFLRFLLGLSLESNQTLLRGLLTQTGSRSHSKEETVKYIKEKIRENPSPEKSINLFHCLNELNDHSLVQEVQTYLSRGGDTLLRGACLSPAQWSAVVFVLLNSEEELDEFELNKYNPSEECLVRLLPVVRVSRKVILSGCGVTEESCKSLTSVLQTENSLKQLEINNNDLKDSGVEQLCAGLKSSNCKLEILRLSGCLVTEEGCSSLASALSSNPSHLKELDLTYNHPGDSGVKLLSARLEDPHCRLDTLRLDHAGKIRLKPGLRKYACELTLDPNTAHTRLSLSEGNRKVTCMQEQQTYPDHPERFDYWFQVMCRESLTGRCYWEAECSGDTGIAVTYKGISRKGDSNDCWFGYNIKSWMLRYCNNRYSVHHNNNYTGISAPSSSNRVGVYLDWPAGILSFYSVSSHTHTLTHLHTFHSTFTEPLYAGFLLYLPGCEVLLACHLPSVIS
ncbi:NLR family CARD domain-containing protein 3-like [Brachyhypopomus gauderio]|uniref:NLR family CARD domain-containing protein 3-like n=1 Tax=Brachyhypopomus gauderio TaxID=698409 RepID=UPI004041786D